MSDNGEWETVYETHTEFEYSDLYAEKPELSLSALKNGEKFNIKVKVKNTGAVGRKETAQCYVGDNVASLISPLKELKGFVKEYYEAGEEKEICFQLGFDELAFYNAKSEFVCESGEFTILVGTNCYADMTITIKVTE